MILLNHIFDKPYCLLQETKFRQGFSIGIAFFVFCFLLIFKPYGLDNQQISFTTFLVLDVLYTIISFVVFYLGYLIIVQRLLKKFTIGSTSLWFFVSCFVSGIFIAIVETMFFKHSLNLSVLIMFQKAVFTIAIIPMTICVLIYNNVLLKRQLHDLNLNITQSDKFEDNVVLTILDGKKTTFSQIWNDVLYISALDNYVEVYYCEDGTINHKLLRHSLSSIEIENQHIDDMWRCHKSFIVNKRKIESITGNTAGYKLKLTNCDRLIPVSRKYNSDIHKLMS